MNLPYLEFIGAIINVVAKSESDVRELINPVLLSVAKSGLENIISIDKVEEYKN